MPENGTAVPFFGIVMPFYGTVAFNLRKDVHFCGRQGKMADKDKTTNSRTANSKVPRDITDQIPRIRDLILKDEIRSVSVLFTVGVNRKEVAFAAGLRYKFFLNTCRHPMKVNAEVLEALARLFKVKEEVLLRLFLNEKNIANNG